MITGLLLATSRSRRVSTSRIHRHLAEDIPPAIHSARSLRSAVDRAVAVVSDDDIVLTAQLRQEGFEVVCCPRPQWGQGAALAFGIRVTGGSTGWLIARTDMPHINPQTAQAVAMKLRAGAIIVVPYFREHRGHPVGFGRALGPQLGALTGNMDTQALIAAHCHLLTKVHCLDLDILADIKAPDDSMAAAHRQAPKLREAQRL
ncbi:MAG: nucleotidyltransferase family protein [Acidiferrobacter sp.]